LPDTVVCYLDGTVGLPLLTAYALNKRGPRHQRRLYERRGEMLDRLITAYREAKAFRDARLEGWALPDVDGTQA
jgi:deoxyhypusine synthase